MSKLYVYSTLAADTTYNTFAPTGDKRMVPDRSVTIKGGAGVMNDRVITPDGVRTEITEEEEAILRQDQVFLLHETNGFVKIVGKKLNADSAAQDMNSGDASRQPTPEDFRDVTPVATPDAAPKPTAAPAATNGGNRRR